MSCTSSKLLLVTHVSIRRGPRGLQIDDQTAAGIAQWCRHFSSVTYYGIEAASDDASASSTAWVDIANMPLAERCRLVALPRAYRLSNMLANYRAVRDLLRREIGEHDHLCFTIGGLVGDWPAVAARQAIRLKRRYGAWIDRVEPLVIRNKLVDASLLKKMLWTVAMPIVDSYTHRILRRSSVALLQGGDSFEYYAKFTNAPHCTYDTHTHVGDQISSDELDHKCRRLASGHPLKILYVGRAAAMKGPEDWLEVLLYLKKRAIPFRATWLGDGPCLSKMKEIVNAEGLSDVVALPGFEDSREIILGAMRESDILLYCHKTPESPRCLIEALVSGCPLVGYDSAYPRDLVKAQGGALLVLQDDVAALANRIVELHHNREQLIELVKLAAASGHLYNEDAVYSHRADLMKLG